MGKWTTNNQQRGDGSTHGAPTSATAQQRDDKCAASACTRPSGERHRDNTKTFGQEEKWGRKTSATHTRAHAERTCPLGFFATTGTAVLYSLFPCVCVCAYVRLDIARPVQLLPIHCVRLMKLLVALAIWQAVVQEDKLHFRRGHILEPPAHVEILAGHFPML